MSNEPITHSTPVYRMGRLLTWCLLGFWNRASIEGRDPVHDLEVIDGELARYPVALDQRPQIVVGSRKDAAQDPEAEQRLGEAARALGRPFLTISSVTGEGLDVLVGLAMDTLERMDAERADAEESEP